jgi:hypothetical protein
MVHFFIIIANSGTVNYSYVVYRAAPFTFSILGSRDRIKNMEGGTMEITREDSCKMQESLGGITDTRRQ